MKNLLYNHFFVILLSIMLIPITGLAYNQTYDVKVGDTFTVYTTYHSNTTAILWTIPYDYVEPVDYVGPVATSVTFRAKKAISSGAIIQAVTYVNYSRKDVDDWLVYISDGSNSGDGENYNLKDGDTFYYLWNGIQMQFKVISASEKTCMVGAGSAEANDLAVSRTLSTDFVFVPATANGYRVVEVATCAFCRCNGIRNIFLSEGITKIGMNAFQDCDALTSFTIPNSVTEISDGAFSYCDNLEELTLGTNLNKMGDMVITGDAKLKKMVSLAVLPPMVTFYTFNDGSISLSSNVTLYVPSGSVANYRSADYWNWFSKIFSIDGDGDGYPFALWCEGNTTLYFLCSTSDIKEGDTYQGHKITNVWSGDDIIHSGWTSYPQWRSVVRDDLTNVVFDTSFKIAKPTTCGDWFSSCSKLTSIQDIENLDVSEVTSLYRMFFRCSNLESLDLSSFNTINVKDMRQMFYVCNSLRSLNMSGLDNRNLTNTESMFAGCSELTELILDGFRTQSVESMSGMFDGCAKLEQLNMASFNTSNVKDMSYMFAGCGSLKKLDLSNFNTEKVTNMFCMFRSSTALQTIYVSEVWNTNSVTNSNDMFSFCRSLVGGNGTRYDETLTDASYARIDKEGAPGYFTDIKTASGIGYLYVESLSNTPIFSLSGQLLAAPKKGINIVGGKKVVIK